MDKETIDLIIGLLSLIFQLMVLILMAWLMINNVITIGEYVIALLIWFIWTSVGDIKVKIEV